MVWCGVELLARSLRSGQVNEGGSFFFLEKKGEVLNVLYIDRYIYLLLLFSFFSFLSLPFLFFSSRLEKSWKRKKEKRLVVYICRLDSLAVQYSSVHRHFFFFHPAHEIA